jgi:hypothetical protein
MLYVTCILYVIGKVRYKPHNKYVTGSNVLDKRKHHITITPQKCRLLLRVSITGNQDTVKDTTRTILIKRIYDACCGVHDAVYYTITVPGYNGIVKNDNSEYTVLTRYYYVFWSVCYTTQYVYTRKG